MKKRFWNFKEHRIRDETGVDHIERVLELNGVIAEDSWWGDEVTPAQFKDDLKEMYDMYLTEGGETHDLQ